MTEAGVRIVPRALGAPLVEQPARAVLHNGGVTMAITSDNDPETKVTVEVTIRIPSGASGDLVTDAEERLTRATGVVDATVAELHGIEPRLSATIITVEVTIQVAPVLSDTEKLRQHLAEAPGVESTPRIGD